MKCGIFLLFSTYLVLISADGDINQEILQRCKYVTCNDVKDLSKETHIRNCIKTTCRSGVLRRADLEKYCMENCIERVSKFHDSMKPKENEEPSTILDYAWLD